jgi:hypothetical protein
MVQFLTINSARSHKTSCISALRFNLVCWRIRKTHAYNTSQISKQSHHFPVREGRRKASSKPWILLWSCAISFNWRGLALRRCHSLHISPQFPTLHSYSFMIVTYFLATCRAWKAPPDEHRPLNISGQPKYSIFWILQGWKAEAARYLIGKAGTVEVR